MLVPTWGVMMASNDQLIITEDSPRQVPIFQAFIRPALLFGAERRLALIILPVCFGLIFVAMNKIAVVFALLLWSGSMYLFRLMAKIDPVLTEVYTRRRRYAKNYYKPRATPFCEMGYRSSAKS